MTKKILIIPILLYCINVFAQDTLFQCDFTINPIHFDKKSNEIGTETTYKANRNIIPSLTFSFPIYKKFSFLFGLKFYQSRYESYFNDSTWQIIDPTNPVLSGRGSYIYHINSFGSELSVLANINYNLFFNKYFTTNISLGLDAMAWNETYEYWEFYPKSETNYSKINDSQFNSPFNKRIYSSNLNITLKYFPLKHFGFLIRPNIYYNRGDVKLYIGIGLCYR